MMGEEGQNRKQILIRKAQGRLLKDRYMEKISDLFHVDTSLTQFIGIEESDQIVHCFYNSGTPLKKTKKTYSLDSNNKISDVLLEVKKCARGEYYVFIDSDWEYCGAFLLNDIEMLNENFVFGKTIIDCFFIVNKNLTDAYLLDYYDDYTEMGHVYFIDIEYWMTQ